MNTTASRHNRSKSFEAKPSAGKPNWLKTIFRNSKSPFVKGKSEKGVPSLTDGLKRPSQDDSCFLYTPSNADATELRISLDEKFNPNKKPLEVVTTNPGNQMFSPFPFSVSSPRSDHNRLRSPRDDFSYMEQATKVIQEKDARIGGLERAKRDIQWKFDLMSVEFTAFKKKAVKDLHDKDNLMDTEKMNLVETCLDLVTENDALKKVAMLDGTLKSKSVVDVNGEKKELNDSFLVAKSVFEDGADGANGDLVDQDLTATLSDDYNNFLASESEKKELNDSFVTAKSVFEAGIDGATGTKDDFTDKWLIDLVNQGDGDFVASKDRQLDLLDVANGGGPKDSLLSCLFPMLFTSN